MWGYLSRSFESDGQPYWLYFLIGTEEKKIDALANQKGVSRNQDGWYFYRLKKFYGPVINVAKKSINGLAAFIPYCASEFSDTENEYCLDLNNRFGFSPSVNLQILFNSFINFHALSNVIKLELRCGESLEVIALKNLLNAVQFKMNSLYITKSDYTLVNIDFEECFKLNFGGELVLCITRVDDEFYPLNKFEIALPLEEEDTHDWSIEKVYFPGILEYYIVHGFDAHCERISEKQKEEEDLWRQKHQKDDYNDSYASQREWIKSELDDMSSMDPNWYWNID